jgi:hypothetical protein
MRRLSTAELVRWRAQSSLLPSRAGDPVTAVSRLLGLQGQDIPAVRLSVRARTQGSLERDVLAALDRPPALVRIWAMRGTLHLVTASDARWLTTLLGPRLKAATAGRRSSLAIPDERCEAALPVLTDVLAPGPLERADIVRGLHDRGFAIEAGSQAVPHLLGYAGAVGLVCCGPGESFALVERWVPAAAQSPDPPDLAAELARRYLAGHGPAAPDDLAAWSGLPITRARAAFAAIDDDVQWWDTELGPMATLTNMPANTGDSPAVRLLPRYDDYLLGWRDREPILDPAHARAIHPGGGVLNAGLVIDGVVRGSWRWVRKPGKRTIAVKPFTPLKRKEIAAIEADAADVGRFLEGDVELVVEPAES